jgi:hypothetical protein
MAGSIDSASTITRPPEFLSARCLSAERANEPLQEIESAGPVFDLVLSGPIQAATDWPTREVAVHADSRAAKPEFIYCRAKFDRAGEPEPAAAATLGTGHLSRRFLVLAA